MSDVREHRLRDLALVFLKLGTTAFGGPAVHIAMMEREVVARRRWLTREEFVDLLGATNLIPGPNSTEMALHVGQRRAGLRGLLVAGICFIGPAAAVVSAIAWTYVRIGRLPQVQDALYGIEAVVIAIVATAILALARTALKTPFLAVLAVVCFVASLGRIDELAILAAAAVVSALRRYPGTSRSLSTTPCVASAAVAGVSAAPSVAVSFGLGPLFWIFLKIGSVLFGSGYVLLAFLRADLVDRLHWLTESQLLDAVAVGQMTPGPVFTTATFIGWVLGGPSAAVAATVAIFVPAFVFVAASGALIPRLRRSPVAGAVLDGVNAASLALMAAVVVTLARTAVVDALTAAFAVGAAVVLLATGINSAWLIAAGALVGVAAHW